MAYHPRFLRAVPRIDNLRGFDLGHELAGNLMQQLVVQIAHDTDDASAFVPVASQAQAAIRLPFSRMNSICPSRVFIGARSRDMPVPCRSVENDPAKSRLQRFPRFRSACAPDATADVNHALRAVRLNWVSTVGSHRKAQQRMKQSAHYRSRKILVLPTLTLAT